uniref:Mitochondrial import receptor subunit TOM22 homolog n=1 Tax=Prolemur simus TaxID=1328070 RepID=A0A8C9DUJ5_PROSS
MFPERVWSEAGAIFFFLRQNIHAFSRAALCIATTFFIILVLPVVFEIKKSQMEQQQLKQQQVHIGPDTGLSGGMPGVLPSLPGKN